MSQDVNAPRFRRFTGTLHVRQHAVLLLNEVQTMLEDDPQPSVTVTALRTADAIADLCLEWPAPVLSHYQTWLFSNLP